TSSDKLKRIVDTNDTRTTNRTTKTWENTQLGFWKTDDGFVAHDAVFTNQGHLTTTAKRCAIDSGYFWKRQVFKTVKGVVDVNNPVFNFAFWLFKRADEFCDISTSDKHAFARRHDKTLYVIRFF